MKRRRPHRKHWIVSINKTSEEKSVREKISFEINYNRLKEYTIYKKENKCISIMIKKEDIEGIDKFDIYEWKNPEIRCSWTNSFTI